jgi:uncharacterized protein YjbI with pentapeptide repeats
MFPEFSDFNIIIENKEFIRIDGVHFARSAILTFVSPGGHHITEVILAYPSGEYISEVISSGSFLNLDHCYIENLSLAPYRQENNIDKKEFIKLEGLSAKNSFINSKIPVDLSYTEFLNGTVSFEDAYFARGEINMQGSVIRDGGLDFTNVHFPNGNFDFTNIVVEKGVYFRNAVFGKGLKNFQDCVFGRGDIVFTNAYFNDGDVSFISSDFGHGNISFKLAKFGTGKIEFHFAKVGDGDISFERTEFGNGRIDFRTVEFGNGRVNFNRAVFGKGNVSFEASQIKTGKISFTKAVFGEGSVSFELVEYDNADAIFDRADFGKGVISFYNARIKNLSLHSCHLDNYTDLRVAQCSYIDLSDTIVRDIIDIRPFDFDIQIDRINFAGMRLIGRIFIDWRENQVKKLIMAQTNTSRRLKSEQFRTLKQNFNTTGQYSDEDKSYVEFKRLESRAILEESLRRNKWSAIWMYPVYLFKLVIFDLMGQYATNPLRVMISMLVWYSFFSLLAAFIVLVSGGDILASYGETTIGVLGRSFYYTAITFLTIGYGDFYPTGSLRVLSGIVGFSGLFLVAYFTVAFVRKVLR